MVSSGIVGFEQLLRFYDTFLVSNYMQQIFLLFKS